MDELTIRKSAQGAAASRLRRQIGKQVSFQKNFQNDEVRTPRILRTAQSAGRFHADMEFITAKDFVQFLSEADRRALEGFLRVVTDFIRRELRAAS